MSLCLSAVALIGCSGPGILDNEVIDRDKVVGDTISHDTVALDVDTVVWMSVADAQRIYDSDDIKYVIVCGYIVGTVKSSMVSGCDFEAPFTAKTNLLLADTPAPESADDCLSVELKKGSDARNSLNLVANPHLLGSRVVVCGTLQRYFRVAGVKSGVKSVLDFEFL